MASSLQSSSAGNREAHLNIYAVGMCSLCLTHCILLPMAAALLPLAGLLSGDELVHKLLVLLAAPATFWLVYRAALLKRNSLFIATALTGLAILLMAAFVERFEDFETSLTVVGATLLGVSHLSQWIRIRRLRQSQPQAT